MNALAISEWTFCGIAPGKRATKPQAGDLIGSARLKRIQSLSACSSGRRRSIKSFFLQEAVRMQGCFGSHKNVEGSHVPAPSISRLTRFSRRHQQNRPEVPALQPVGSAPGLEKVCLTQPTLVCLKPSPARSLVSRRDHGRSPTLRRFPQALSSPGEGIEPSACLSQKAFSRSLQQAPAVLLPLEFQRSLF